MNQTANHTMPHLSTHSSADAAVANDQHSTLTADWQQIGQLLEAAKQQGLDYLQSLEQRHTSNKHSLCHQPPLPDHGDGSAAAMHVFNEHFEPLLVASAGPRYWGFVTGGSTPASIVGDWLATVYDQNSFGTNGHGDRSALIEMETIRLLLQLFELPADYFGAFVTGATMSNFTALAVARQWLGHQMGYNIALDGVPHALPVLAATPHSSALKSLSMLGMGSRHLLQVPVLPGNREAMDIAELEKQIQQLGGKPFILIASGGTVNTVDFDDMQAIAQLKKKYHFWWHIDAAFGGFAICSSEHKHLLKGWEFADSITIDCHKWLNVPYESAVFLIKDQHKQLQAETFQNANAPYLGDPNANFSTLNFLPENSRRLKALPAWFSLMAYGKDGYAEIVQRNIRLARLLGSHLESDPRFKLLAPVRLNTVCFTLDETKTSLTPQQFLQRLNDTQQVYMTPTVYKGQQGIRAAMVNWLTKEADVELAFSLMKQVLDQP